MQRRLIPSVAAALWLAPGLLSAQPGDALAPTVESSQESSDESSESASATDDEHTQDIGAHLGFELGGRTTPGGFGIGGEFVYRLSDVDWLDTGVGFVFGSGDASCFRDRDNQTLCNHGIASGFAGEVNIGIRRYLPATGNFAPFIRGGVSGRFVAFPGDDLRGVAFPLWFGAGVRAKVANRVHVVAGALVRGGIAFMNRGLETEPHFSLKIYSGVEFEL